jgi:hypothetical protein
MAALPNLVPTDMSLALGSYRVKPHNWRDIWEAPELGSSLEHDIRLALSYTNIQPVQGISFLRLYRRNAGAFIQLDTPLPQETVSGVLNSDLRAYLQAPPGLVWVMAEPPTYRAVKAGVVTVEVSLLAELR